MLRNLPCNLARKVAARGKMGSVFCSNQYVPELLGSCLAGGGTLIVWSDPHPTYAIMESSSGRLPNGF